MSLEERIERIERQNRRLKAAVLIVGAGLALVVGMAAANDRFRGEVSIEAINGQRQIALATHTDFGPAIILFDGGGCERLRIGCAYTQGGAGFIEFYGPGPAPGQRGQFQRRID